MNFLLLTYLYSFYISTAIIVDFVRGFNITLYEIKYEMYTTLVYFVYHKLFCKKYKS
jgi:hypothetical protein